MKSGTPASTPSPADLVLRIRSGDLRAESELVERYSRGLRAIVGRATRDSAAAEDVFQEVFRLAIEKIRAGEVHSPENLSGFMCALARNLAVEYYRRRRRHDAHEPIEVAERGLASRGTPFDEVLARERAMLVREVLEELETDRDRQILFRFYIAEEEKEGICEDLGLTSLHFNRVLFRARQRYRELFEKRSAKGRVPEILLVLSWLIWTSTN